MPLISSLKVNAGWLERRSGFWRVVFAAAAILWSLALYATWQHGLEINQFGPSIKWRLLAAGALLAAAVLWAAAIIVWTKGFDPLVEWLQKGTNLLRSLGALNLLPLAACLGVYLVLIYTRYGPLLNTAVIRFSLLVIVGLAAGVFLRALLPSFSWSAAFLGAILLAAIAQHAAGLLFQISSDPLSIGWSEASRFYYASLFFAKPLYGQALPLPFLHPTRYLLQSLPFLIPGLPIEVHRAWQVALWLGLTALAALLLVRRLAIPNRAIAWIAGAWTFLFIAQGPVYYHLLVPVCLVMWGFAPRKFWQSLLTILAASIWAGISRINWLPVPAMLAVAIYLIETPECEARGLVDYLRRPALWSAAGMAGAFVAQWLYKRFSGNDPSVFNSSFTSDLLWNRLLPNSTYPPGILPVTLMVSLPLMLLVGLVLWQRRLSFVRGLGIAAMLLVLFAGGLVVSVKIGGGGNLHNMDAFLTLLLVCGVWMAFNRAIPEKEAPPVRVHWALALLVVIVPVFALSTEFGPYKPVNVALMEKDTARIRAAASQVATQGGRVLFIWQRQLVTFRQVPDTGMEPRYETVDLMEMAMAGNQAYLDQFYQDLREHRFALIVSSYQNVLYKDATNSFPEENNVWVERVSIPLLQYYRIANNLPDSGTQLLVPK